MSASGENGNCPFNAILALRPSHNRRVPAAPFSGPDPNLAIAARQVPAVRLATDCVAQPVRHLPSLQFLGFSATRQFDEVTYKGDSS